MSATIPYCVCDSDAFGDTITVQQVYDLTGKNGGVSISGTATFTYTRVRLADLAKFPKLLCDGQSLYAQLKEKTFVAVRFGVGRMPGWLVVFGSQPTKQDAFTATSPGYNYKVDADCELSLNCARVAPNRQSLIISSGGYYYGVGSNGIIGFNGGTDYGLETKLEVQDTTFSVTQLSAGFPADPSVPRAEIPPVYRVELPLPGGTANYQGFSFVVNGRESPVAGFDYLYSALQQAVNSVTDLDNVIIESRAPGVCDVQMSHFGDTLAAGTVSYNVIRPLDSTLGCNGQSKTIDNPFPMTGQSVVLGPGDSGLTITVQF